MLPRSCSDKIDSGAAFTGFCGAASKCGGGSASGCGGGGTVSPHRVRFFLKAWHRLCVNATFLDGFSQPPILMAKSDGRHNSRKESHTRSLGRAHVPPSGFPLTLPKLRTLCDTRTSVQTSCKDMSTCVLYVGRPSLVRQIVPSSPTSNSILCQVRAHAGDRLNE